MGGDRRGRGGVDHRLTLLTRPLVGAIWGLVLVIAASVHAYRWLRDWRARDVADNGTVDDPSAGPPSS